jgi:hypothetical protein
MALHTKAYSIKNQWINMSLYFINFMYTTKKPFLKTKVGSVVANRYFRYGVYLYTFYPFILSGPGGWFFLATTVGPNIAQVELLIEFAQFYGSDYQDDTQVCKNITLINRLKDDSNKLGGSERNTKWLANGDYIKTNFIKLDKTDIVWFFEKLDSGFRLDKTVPTDRLNGANNYMRNSNDGTKNISNQERDNSSNKNNDNIFYFLKGRNANDLILYSLSKNAL